jgi:hypothetical protein
MEEEEDPDPGRMAVIPEDRGLDEDPKEDEEENPEEIPEEDWEEKVELPDALIVTKFSWTFLVSWYPMGPAV